MPRGADTTASAALVTDVGLDTGTSVDDKDDQVPFAFTGKLDKITIDLGESSVSPEAIRLMMGEPAKKRDR